MMENHTWININLSPSQREFLERFLLIGYIIVANVFAWYAIPDRVFITNPYVIGASVFFFITGLLLLGSKGPIPNVLMFVGGIAFIHAAFFPFYFLFWLIGLLYAFLVTIPFPIAGNVGRFLQFSLLTLAMLFLISLLVIDRICGKKKSASDESDDYSSPTFTLTLGGGRWG